MRRHVATLWLSVVRGYWIISKDFNIKHPDCDKNDCDSIIQSHVNGPLNRAEFNAAKPQLEMHLDFKHLLMLAFAADVRRH